MSTELFSIRNSTDDDVVRITAIYRHYVLHSAATFELAPPDVEEMANRRSKILSLGLPYLVAEKGSEVIGYAYASAYRPRPAYRFTVEDSLYVDPAFAGQGCGRLLLRELLVRCEQGAWSQMIAVIAGTSDDASIRLHQRFGFRNVGTLQSVGYKFEQWIDTILMQRSLKCLETDSPGRS
jgi:phosphinothricin acetyltransferase